MIQWLKKHWEVLSYLIFGVLTTLLNILLYALFNRLFGYTAANSWGNVLDNILCILFAYATNRAFVFRSKTRGREQAKEFTAFVSCRLGTLLLDAAIMLVLGNLLAAQGAALMDSHERPADPCVPLVWPGHDGADGFELSGHASGHLGWFRGHCRYRRGRWAHGHFCHQPH